MASGYADENNAETETATSLTIYSSATPGAISPELYRPSFGNIKSDGYDTGYDYSISQSIPGYAIVRLQRDVELKQSPSKISLSNVATLIDPTTVMVKSLTDPQGTNVSEQDYRFDLVSTAKLLEKYIGLYISVEQTHGTSIETYSGKLLSTNGGLILQDKDGKTQSIRDYANIRFPDLPGGLITKPTLVWNIYTKNLGKHKIEASYQTSGITWWADYNAVYEDSKNASSSDNSKLNSNSGTLNANQGTLDLNAWVSIVNKTGASFDNVKLKLIAGEVNRATPKNFYNARLEAYPAAALGAQAPSFAEKPFFDFHLYTLDKPTTLSDNSTKQLELFPKISLIPVEKQYVYNGATQLYYGQINTNRNDSGANTKVDIYIKLKNSKKDGLGIPLPAGRIRISKFDPEDKTLEFVGEDIINHTAVDEEVKIKVGSAFDVVGDRKQISFTEDSSRRVMEENIEITLRNHKSQDINVLVKENLYRGENWKIIESSVPYEKLNAQTAQFPILVKKGEESKIRYTVRYSW